MCFAVVVGGGGAAKGGRVGKWERGKEKNKNGLRSVYSWRQGEGQKSDGHARGGGAERQEWAKEEKRNRMEMEEQISRPERGRGP